MIEYFDPDKLSVGQCPNGYYIVYQESPSHSFFFRANMTWGVSMEHQNNFFKLFAMAAGTAEEILRDERLQEDLLKMIYGDDVDTDYVPITNIVKKHVCWDWAHFRPKVETSLDRAMYEEAHATMTFGDREYYLISSLTVDVHFAWDRKRQRLTCLKLDNDPLEGEDGILTWPARPK